MTCVTGQLTPGSSCGWHWARSLAPSLTTASDYNKLCISISISGEKLLLLWDIPGVARNHLCKCK